MIVTVKMKHALDKITVSEVVCSIQKFKSMPPSSQVISLLLWGLRRRGQKRW